MAVKGLLLGVALASVAAGMFSNQRRRRLTMGGSGPTSSTGLANSDRDTGSNLARDMSSASDSGRGTPGLSSGTGMGGSSLTGGTPGTNDDLLSPGTTGGVGPTPGGPL